MQELDELGNPVNTCPEEFAICMTEEEWLQFVSDYEAGIINEIGGLPVPESTGDAQAVADFDEYFGRGAAQYIISRGG